MALKLHRFVWTSPGWAWTKPFAKSQRHFRRRNEPWNEEMMTWWRREQTPLIYCRSWNIWTVVYKTSLHTVFKPTTSLKSEKMILNGKFVDKHGEMYGGMVWLRRVRDTTILSITQTLSSMTCFRICGIHNTNKNISNIRQPQRLLQRELGIFETVFAFAL